MGGGQERACSVQLVGLNGRQQEAVLQAGAQRSQAGAPQPAGAAAQPQREGAAPQAATFIACLTSSMAARLSMYASGWMPLAGLSSCFSVVTPAAAGVGGAAAGGASG